MHIDRTTHNEKSRIIFFRNKFAAEDGERERNRGLSREGPRSIGYQKYMPDFGKSELFTCTLQATDGNPAESSRVILVLFLSKIEASRKGLIFHDLK